ncbi:class I SAM-dependent methyltransferase [Sphingomonas quercus]|uniref:Class I SAM-dependent methyltransferase n=1 Tax=Sphingomonas quercus TaxID=2842451 RepID=A0ABS6BG82_9SPHN|nr:class I SAM-dependent methyltransferase [Sphingomonas quercus]MBU3077179.1 class I SAM-dependent methyltransferase [Sphingomonas quercus]
MNEGMAASEAREAPIDWPALARAPDPCLICGETAHEALYPPSYHGTIAGAAGYFLAHRAATAHGPIVRCGGCGFVFTSPRFSGADYDRIYGGIHAPDNLDEAFDAAKAARFRRLGDIVRRHLPEGGDFLDLGCGDGGFLRLFDDPRGRGFEVGLPGRRSAGRSEVITGDWASFATSPDCPRASLDYLTAFDVLEHLPRIDEDVALIRAVLKPGGLFFASVPNVESLVARAMGRRWNMLLLEHLWYFSPATLARFLARHGFEQIEVRSVPFDAPVAHIATRLAQTFGMKGTFGVGALSRMVLPAPAGIMLGVYRAR